MNTEDIAYFRRRAEAELRMAEESADPVVARVHQTLADLYAERASNRACTDPRHQPVNDSRGNQCDVTCAVLRCGSAPKAEPW